jgi:hypothetical protein
MRALFARWYCARVVFREMRLGAHSASWEWCRAHRGGVAVELAPATAGTRAEGDVFFDVATCHGYARTWKSPTSRNE